MANRPETLERLAKVNMLLSEAACAKQLLEKDEVDLEWKIGP